MFKLLSGCLLIAGLALGSGELRAESVVSCESIDYQNNYCPVNTRGGVRIIRQFSEARCRQGESWGYDRRGIWVSDGCAADFEVGTTYRRVELPGSVRLPEPDPYTRGRGDRGGARIMCESTDYGYNFCPVRIRGNVDLIYQQSITECRFNRNWGYNRRGIWVDSGCSAEFAVY